VRPAWTYALMPAAVLLAGLAIAAALWFALDDDGGDDTTAVADAGGDGASESRVETILSAFLRYAGETGIDAGRFRECLGTPETSERINAHLQQGFSLGLNSTPTFFINNKKVLGSQPAAVFDEIIAAELRGPPASAEGYSETIRQLAAAGRFEIVNYRPDITSAEIEGNRSARVVFAEFSDFQCPFCKRWNDQYLGTLRKRLGDGIAIAFLHFPLTQIHPNSGNASAAAVCAGEQDRFWQMHDLLFAKQDEWKDLRP